MGGEVEDCRTALNFGIESLKLRTAHLTLGLPLGLQVAAGMKEIRDRIASVKNTSKITEVSGGRMAENGDLAGPTVIVSRVTQAMKLVAAAKVRRAQDAVINSRPFSENLVKVRSHHLSL